MKKSAFIHKMTWPLIGLGIVLSSFAYIPVIRAIFGIDETITIHFSTMLVFLVGGYMAALAGLMTWHRGIAIQSIEHGEIAQASLKKPHLIGLCFLIPVPFLSCLLLGWFWQKERQQSEYLDEIYREVSNFHLSLHLYLLVSFFLMPIVIGFIMFALLMITFIVATLFHLCIQPKHKSIARYPINIQIATKPRSTEA